MFPVLGGVGNSNCRIQRRRISLSLTCLLVFVFSISLIGIIFQFITVHRIVINNDDESRTNNNAAASLMMQVRGGGGGDDHLNNTPKKKDDDKPIIVIAYAITITGCGEKGYSFKDATSLITQGAAILKHSIHLAHNHHTTNNNNKKSKYEYQYQMYAIIHPTATSCSVAPMKKLGYKVLIRNTPFDKSDISTKFLRENIDGASCCGAKEFLKLYAYTFVDHPIAVVLDLDSLVLKSMDVMFDVMMTMMEQQQQQQQKLMMDRLPIHVNSNGGGQNGRIDAFYTKDYNMINPGGEKYAGVQGGFLILRPDEDVFAEYISLVLQGNYIEGKGWGGKYGYFFGGAQVQGICSYYFSKIHPEKGVELNRCRINQMVDNPHFDNVGKCRDGREECEDCRTTELNDIYSSHFTLCGKPWHCNVNSDPDSLCSKLHSEWFRIRRSYEESRGDDDVLKFVPKLEGSYRPEIFHGYCTKRGYLPLKI